jgi:hypothetical protein
MLPLTLALPVALLVLPFAVARAFAVVLQQCTLSELAFCRVVMAWLRSSLFDVVAVTALITWRLGLSHGEGGTPTVEPHPAGRSASHSGGESA